jgi:hypothetical protein
MFRTVVILFSLIWASLLLVSWNGGEPSSLSNGSVVVEAPHS